MNRKTTRYLLLRILAEHPNGLSAKRLAIAANQYRVVTATTQTVSLSNARKAGLVKHTGAEVCECCGGALLLYALTKLGMEEVKNAL